MERVRLPADVELEDRLAFGLTARQLLLLFATALTAYGGYAFAATVAPLPLAVAAAAPLALAGTLLALGRFEGLPADRLALAALRHLRAPRRRVLAPQGLPAALRSLPAPTRLAPLELPVRTILRSGLVELEGSRHSLHALTSKPRYCRFARSPRRHEHTRAFSPSWPRVRAFAVARSCSYLL